MAWYTWHHLPYFSCLMVVSQLAGYFDLEVHSRSQHIWEWGSLVLELINFINFINYTCLFTSFLLTGYTTPCSLLSCNTETTDSPIISCNPGFSSSLLAAWGCRTPPEQTASHRWSDLRKRRAPIIFLSCINHRGGTKKKKKSCDKRSMNTVNWYCCQVGWLVGWIVRVCTLLPDCFPTAVTEKKLQWGGGGGPAVGRDWMEWWLSHPGLALLVLLHHPRQTTSFVLTRGSNSSQDFTALPLQ